MATPGFGICGHKNAFNTGVKIGNYVEDRFGSQLAAVSKTQPLARVSEASANYIDPRDMADKCVNAPLDDPTSRDLVRAGLPYNLVFGHGAPHVATRDELTAKYTPTSTDFGAALARKPTTMQHDETLRRTRELKNAREARESRHGSYVTTAQAIVPATVRSTGAGTSGSTSTAPRR